MIAPEREFRYRPMSAGSLFRPAKERSLAIADLVAESGATWFMDRVEVVREAERSVLTRDGDTVEFDFLLPAPGKRSARANRRGGRAARRSLAGAGPTAGFDRLISLPTASGPFIAGGATDPSAPRASAT